MADIVLIVMWSQNFNFLFLCLQRHRRYAPTVTVVDTTTDLPQYVVGRGLPYNTWGY